MPLTQQEKIDYLTLVKGVDPSKFDFNEDTGEVVPKSPEPSGSVSVGQPIVSKPTYGMAETASRNAALGVIPAAGGFWAGSAAGLPVGTALAPFTFGASEILAPLAFGIAGAYGASKLQSKALEQTDVGKEFLVNTAEANQQNPVSAVAGNLAASIPFMRFNPGMIKDAYKAFAGGGNDVGALSALGEAIASPAGRNVALGAGVGAGQGLYDELTSNEPFNYGRFGLNVAGGALLNDPRSHAFNEAIGLHPYVRPSGYNAPERGAQPLPDEIAQQVLRSKPAPSQLDMLGPSYVERPFGMSPKEYLARYEEMASKQREEQALKESGLTPPEQRGQAEGQVVTPEATQPEPLLPQYPVIKKPTGDVVSPLHQTELPRVEPSEQVPREQLPDLEQLHREISNAEEGLKQQHDEVLRQSIQQKIDSMKETALKIQKIRYQQQEQSQIELQKQQQKEAEGVQQANLDVAKQHGIQLKVNPTKSGFTTPEGVKVSGVSNPTERTAEINLQKPDTGGHELTHVKLEDVSPRLKERLLSAVEREKNTPGSDIQKWFEGEQKAGRSPNNEEALAQLTGETFSKRILNRDSNLRRDLTAWFRSNYSPNATSGDVARYMTSKLFYGKGEPAKAGSIANAAEVKQQPEEQQSVSPKQLYDDSYAKLSEAMKSGSPEMKDLWAKHEGIKNKYFEGHTPEGFEKQQKALVSKPQLEEQKQVTNKQLLDATLPKDFKSNAEQEKYLTDKMLTGKTREHDENKLEALAGKNEEDKQKYWAMKEQLSGDPSRNQEEGQKQIIHPNYAWIDKNGNITPVSEFGHVPEGKRILNNFDLGNSEVYTKMHELGYARMVTEPNGKIYFDSPVLTKEQKAAAERIGIDKEKTVIHVKPQMKIYDREESKTIYEPPAKTQNESQNKIDYSTTDESKKGFLRVAEPVFDSVERVSKPLAQHFRNWEVGMRDYIGLKNAAMKDAESQGSREDVSAVTAKMRENYRGNRPNDDLSNEFTGNQKDIYNTLSGYYSKIRDEQISSGLTIDGRKAGQNRNYVPDQLSEHALDLLLNKSRTPQGKAAVNDWVNHIVDTSDGKIKESEARDYVTKYITAIGGKDANYNAVKFGALRKAEGFGLPESLREKDGVLMLDKYGKRAARDLSMYKHIESVPEVASMLQIPDPKTGEIPKVEGVDSTISSTPEVRNAMKMVTGTMTAHHPLVNSIVRTTMNALLGTATGLRDTASVLGNMVPYMHQWSDLGTALKGMSQFRDVARAALETGARQPSMDKVLFNQAIESPTPFTAILNKGATLLRKYQGREAIENFNRNITFGAGKELAKSNILGAIGGNEKSKAWLEKFGTLVDTDKILNSKEMPSDEVLNKIAANFVDRNQGTYGGRGLSIGMFDSTYAPYLALQKWSIEKSNVIYQDVVKPFMDGSNRVPLLTYTLGSVLTGAGIQELNKLLTNRKPQEADVKESLAVADDEHKSAVVQELATLMQLGSYGGIVSDVLKSASDLAIRGKVPRNIVSFPTATMAADMGDKIANFSEAIHQGEDPWNTLKMFTLDMLNHNVQALRMVGNYSWNKDDVERSDKFRDLRVYNELQGQPTSEPSNANKYLNQDVKKFKETDDMGEALGYLPAIYKKFTDKVAENPEKALQFMESVKGNNYQTVPSPENTPMEFMNYWRYLEKTQGEDKARERIIDFFRQSELNKAKNQLVGV